jgi:hypothetical protein
MTVIKKERTRKGTLKWTVRYKRMLIQGGSQTQFKTLYACTQKEMLQYYKTFKSNNNYYNRLVGCQKEPERLAYL